VVSLINGVSPFLAGLATALPLILVFFGIGIETAFIASIIAAMVILFFLGSFLGRVSRSNVIVYGLKTLGAGLVVMMVIWLFSITTGL
jgi:predicted membrane protein (TIGR00267 family)